MPQSGRDIIFTVDLSGSMQISDMVVKGQEVNRLDAVKIIARDFIKYRKGDRLGLILFGSHAYLQTPLTFDTATVQAMLEDANVGLAGDETAIGDAIGVAIKRLQQSAQQNRVLVLFTDGASNAGILTPIEAAELAAQQQVRIYTVGIGNDNEIISGLTDSQARDDQLDTKTLQTIAQISGGIYFRVKDTAGLHRVSQVINKIEPVHSGHAALRATTLLYPWPLTLALLLSMQLVMQVIKR